jgi:hypothetical protein
MKITFTKKSQEQILYTNIEVKYVIPQFYLFCMGGKLGLSLSISQGKGQVEGVS